ncbi:MAG: FKBP-type peptidyl-prolyl cis-trans isomerase [Bacteroidetes bacterium]|jgi:FKBP-type peptidyl-prolyl cis-trans isomerase|nr:FKBP-type peptidyl-prolyl cis-trans isomerase [Bacteroidota bacterium]
MNKLLIASAGVMAIAFASCSGDDRFPGYDKTETGIYYKLHKEGDATKPVVEGDVVFISQVMYTDKDSLLFDSKKMLQPGEPYAVKIGKSMYTGDMFDAIKMMHLGDSMTFCLNAKDMWAKAYKQPLPAFLDSTSYLKYSIKIDSIYGKDKVAEIEKQQAEMMKQQQAMQEEMAKQYQGMEDSLLQVSLKKFKVSAKPTASGLYFMEIKKGTGPKLKMGDVAQVKYTGMLVNGETFDSSEGRPEPLSVVIGSQEPGERVIDAWTETLLMMSVGSKVKIVCPSSIAYGPMGNGPIPPYAPLYFDMEVVGIKSAK